MDTLVRLHLDKEDPTKFFEITMSEEDTKKIGKGSIIQFKHHLGKVSEVQLVDEKTHEILNRFPVIG